MHDQCWVGNRSRFHGRLIRGRLLVACVSVWLIGFAVAAGQTDPRNASGITSGNVTGDTDSRPTLYVTATAHLDTQWLWTIQDTIDEYIPDTLRGNFALFEKLSWSGSVLNRQQRHANALGRRLGRGDLAFFCV